MQNVKYGGFLKSHFFSRSLLNSNCIIQICSGITRGRVLSGELCTEIIEVNLSAFVYRLFYEDFSSIDIPSIEEKSS